MSPYNNERGIALVIVLWVTVLLTVIVSGFIALVRTEARSVANYKDESQAYFLARSGVSLAIDMLLEQKINAGVRKAMDTEEQWVLDGTPIKVSLNDNAFVEITITDESGKLDLNTADKTVLERTLTYMEIGEDERDVIVSSILDWLDENNFHRLNGAEDDYYATLSEPYESKDAPINSIEELLWVRGVTPELFYGRVKTSPEAFLPYLEEPRSKAGLARLFTVFTGKVSVNVNTAPFELLLSIPGIDDEIASRIIEARKETKFRSIDDLLNVGVRPDPALGKYITFTSLGFYTVITTGGFEKSPARYSVKAVVEITKDAHYRILYWKDRETIRRSLI